jgi:membrane associated rhomboid family serine protease
MDRIGGIGFCLIFAALGWAFSPFDTQPKAALIVSVSMSVIGICGALYFHFRKDEQS